MIGVTKAMLNSKEKRPQGDLNSCRQNENLVS